MKYSLLLTDYYQLTMGYAYWQLGLHERDAVFHLFFRRNPLHSEYVMASGLQSVIDCVQDFHFSADDLDFLAMQYVDVFSKDFLTYLKNLRFTGDIDAVSEGSLVFANEPLLRIRAPLIVCQLLETVLINAINFSSAVSTTASRMRHCVGSALLFEFGLRRAQGPDGGMTASRAAFIGGFDATSNVLAGKHFDIPLVGTMSHGWIMSFDDELTAFREYARLMPHNIILLVDTYETAKGIENAIIVGHELKASGEALKGIRLDSGDLLVLSCLARKKLDQAGLTEVKVFVSGDLSNEKIAVLKAAHAPIDGFGVGTYLTTSYSQPALDMVYKIGAIKKDGVWQYKLKCSDNFIKTSDPGILQTKRFYQDKKWMRDVIYHEAFGVTENYSAEAEDLLKPIFRQGKYVAQQVSIRDSQAHGLRQVAQFHFSKGLAAYRVARDKRLETLKEQLVKKMRYGKQ
ncbi:MAG: nicotinate phosphoribosyltransferase [Coxiellaceae bacterium]|nr:nicotinate phosphoribosyltransferase [Coxiellaceae bacterium]